MNCWHLNFFINKTKKKFHEKIDLGDRILVTRKKQDIFKYERNWYKDCIKRFIDWFESTNYTSNINQINFLLNCFHYLEMFTLQPQSTSETCNQTLDNALKISWMILKRIVDYREVRIKKITLKENLAYVYSKCQNKDLNGATD